MDKQNSFNDPKKKLPLDDEEFSFKVISEGLGFHKKRESTPLRTLKAPTQPQPQKSLKSSLKKSQSMGELSAFYQDQTIPDEVKLTNVLEERTSRQLGTKPKEIEGKADAHLAARFLAFGIDFTVSLVFFASTMSLAFLSSGLELPLLLNKAFLIEFVYILLPLFLLFQCLYYSFLETGKRNTLGKALLGIKTTSLSLGDINASQSFFRFVLVSLSFLGLGVPNLFKFQDKISDTMVIKL